VYLLSCLFRAVQWDILIRPLGREVRTVNTFLSVMIGYVANAVFPRAGELIRCGVLSRYEKVPVEKLFGTVVVSRTLDTVVYAALIGLTLLLEFDIVWGFLTQNAFADGGEQQPLWGSPLFWIGMVTLISAIVAWIFRKELGQSAVFQKIKKIVTGFAEGLLSIRKVDKPYWLIFHTLMIWLCYYLQIRLFFYAFDPTAGLSPVAALTVFVFGSLGYAIPAPGGVGAFQYLVTLALATFYAVSRADAFSFSNIAFFPVYFTNLIVGLLALGLIPLLNRKPEAQAL